MIGEFVAGWLSNSVAVWSDALHMLSDLTGYLINYFGLKLSLRPPSTMWTFGYERVEVVAAIASIFIVLLLTIGLCWEASQRIVHPQDVDGEIMIIVAGVGILTNITLSCVLSQDGHGHSHFGIGGGCSGSSQGHKKKKRRKSNTEMGYHKLKNSNPSEELGVETQNHGNDHHDNRDGEQKHDHCTSSLEVDPSVEIKDGHSHGHGHAHSRSVKSIAVQSSYLHALGDLIQNVGVLVAGVMITQNPEMFKVMDPICTFCFAIIVFAITTKLLCKALYVLMETAPRNINAKEMVSTIADFHDVQAVRDFHIWNVGYTQTVLTAKLDVTVENKVEENKHRCHCAVQYNVREKVKELAADKGINHCDLEIVVVSCKHSGERERKVVG